MNQINKRKLTTYLLDQKLRDKAKKCHELANKIGRRENDPTEAIYIYPTENEIKMAEELLGEKLNEST